MKKKTQEQFILEAKEVHGDKYDYSKVEYMKSSIKVIITCNQHGNFEQRPNDHLRGNGCPLCAGNNFIKTQEQFIQEAVEKHCDKYDYSKVDYKTTNTKVIIICKNHGDFEQTPCSHLQGQGCKRVELLRTPKKIEKQHINLFKKRLQNMGTIMTIQRWNTKLRWIELQLFVKLTANLTKSQ